MSSRNRERHILSLKPIREKRATLILLKKTEVTALSNHWYKRRMIYCRCGPIMRKEKPGLVSTCRGDSFWAVVIRSSVFGFYLDFTEQANVSAIFLRNVAVHVRATLFAHPAKLFVSILVAPLRCSCLQVFFACLFSFFFFFPTVSCNYTPAVIRTVPHVNISLVNSNMIYTVNCRSSMWVWGKI